VYHPPVRLVLVSASPRRAELLSAAGFAFDVQPADVDETPRPDEGAPAYVRRLAAEKARAAERRCGLDAVLLAADTTVVLDGRILGKPADEADAAGMLEALAGRTHEVLTGVALRRGDAERVDTECTRVTFAPMSPGDVAWYVASGEPFDKAGAYGIQGRASRFVERVEGSYSNVVGLPVALVVRLLRDVCPALLGYRP
jgi:septum formation protein